MFLQELQDKSHAAYSEGGLLYTFVEAANQAHSRLPEDHGVARSSELAPSDVNALAIFFQSSQGDYLREEPAPPFIDVTQELLGKIRADLAYNEIMLEVEDGGHDMAATLSMARRSDNRFFSLELWWSID
ncbi:hypothetical protein [Steroidobacter cummioxidans]|uniref:hypothetical protein n=1 Tax=Steroidobacter cummioxidans TaxID=1803913 RepID=UPI0012904AA5|nr:hypothetical protein [Steroidobacter cummioxidans]